VLAVGADDEGSWLVTAALPGHNAIEDPDPARAVAAIGEGLRAFHEALPIEQCPFSWSTAGRLDEVRSRRHDPRRWNDGHRHLTVDAALRILDDPPEPDVTVVCHGDACAPNTLVGDDGGCSGHVDLVDLGVGDRWADLAVATWSTEWNYGPGWERRLLDGYGVAPDPERTAYFRLLWDLGPDLDSPDPYLTV
jgi:kanamycin kinase